MNICAAVCLSIGITQIDIGYFGITNRFRNKSVRIVDGIILIVHTVNCMTLTVKMPGKAMRRPLIFIVTRPFSWVVAQPVAGSNIVKIYVFG